MGEYADYMLNGDDCQSCGEYLGDGDGFPRNCAGCEGELYPGDDLEPLRQAKKKRKTTKSTNPIQCDLCNKIVGGNDGLRQHKAAKHPQEAGA